MWHEKRAGLTARSKSRPYSSTQLNRDVTWQAGLRLPPIPKRMVSTPDRSWSGVLHMSLEIKPDNVATGREPAGFSAVGCRGWRVVATSGGALFEAIVVPPVIGAAAADFRAGVAPSAVLV
jgi:hypothetical protein